MNATAEMIEDAAIKEFASALRGMTDVQIERELERSQRALEEIEPWVEALCAMQARRARLARALAPELLALVKLVHGSFGGGLTMTFSEEDVARFGDAIAKASDAA